MARQCKMAVISISLLIVFLTMSGCSTSHEVQVKPVEIKPIHITIDVNVRVQQELNSILDELEEE